MDIKIVRILILALFPAVLITVSLFFSCRHETDGLDELPKICFQTQVLPIFQSSCGISGCHDESTAEAGYVLRDYAGIMKGVNAGNPDKSEVYSVLINLWSDEMMPPNQPLSIENRSIIRLWIEQGAKNNSCNDTSGTPAKRACFERDILPVLQSSCALSGCHDQATAEEGYNYTSYASTMNKGVNEGNPNSSKLYEVLVEDNPEDRMPPTPYNRLPQAQIDSIYNWISYGALNETCETTTCNLTNITYNATITPILQTHCIGCHSGSSPSGSINLSVYSEIQTIAGNGRLMGAVKRQPLYSPMPPAGTLPTCKINQLESWVTAGAPNN